MQLELNCYDDRNIVRAQVNLVQFASDTYKRRV